MVFAEIYITISLSPSFALCEIAMLLTIKK